MKLAQLLYEVAARSGANGSREVERVVRALAATITENVSRGERVHIPGLGVFRARARKGREVLAPDGSHHLVPARFVLTFRAFESVRILREGR